MRMSWPRWWTKIFPFCVTRSTVMLLRGFHLKAVRSVPVCSGMSPMMISPSFLWVQLTRDSHSAAPSCRGTKRLGAMRMSWLARKILSSSRM